MARKSKEERDRADAVIDPALRDSESEYSRLDKSQQEMSSSRRQFDTHPPSPTPPIATIPNSHSPSPSVVSVDRSSNNTPHIRRSPSNNIPMYSYHDRYRQDQQQQPPPISHHGYPYAQPPFDPRYDHHNHYQQQHYLDNTGHHYSPSGLPTHYIPGPMQHPQPPPPPPPGSASYGHHYPMPGQPPVSVVHTSDANTKLTDGIRRRCFNCCTTDTSTWRRSNLSPGKVLCNKCGLFERTHSRPRPEQFPHKRGALAASNLRGRTPPGGAGSSTQLPPIAAATGGAAYQYHHTSLNPLSTGGSGGGDYASSMHHQHPHSNTLPGLQSWHNTSGGSTSSSTSATNGPPPPPPPQATTNGASANGTGAEGPPLLHRRTLDGSPRMNSTSSAGGGGANGPGGGSNGNGGGRFDDLLSSNAADPHARSHPPSPPLPLSRSSTANHHQHVQQEAHTPPPNRDA